MDRSGSDPKPDLYKSVLRIRDPVLFLATGTFYFSIFMHNHFASKNLCTEITGEICQYLL
jgi:hypothetical protein